MISFFRKIRQKLLQQNRVTRYLTYAVGEILLVVIGILIALQVNNWNETRKELGMEKQLLAALLKDLDQNQERIKDMIQYDSSVVNRNTLLQFILKDKSSIYHDSLQSYFNGINTYKTFFPLQMAYENLKTKGLNIIRNDSIREGLVELYDESYFHTQHIGERKSESNLNSNEFFVKHLRWNSVGATPNDFESLKMNSEFLNRLSFITEERKGTIYQSRYILERTRKLSKLIEKEIHQK